MRKILVGFAIFSTVSTLILVLLWTQFSETVTQALDRTPGELIRYAKRRLEGHTRLEAVALPPLHFIQAKIERPVPPGPLPTLGKGQQVQALPALPGQNTQATLVIGSAEALIQAVGTAPAGSTLLLAPGTYRISSKIKTGFGGTAQQRITLRAQQPGQVLIEFNALEGFVVNQPYWVFENLTIRGICQRHTDCEHAFHVVGNARNTVLRNNYIENFNAHLKINGEGGNWPDNGEVQYNTLTNTARRETHLPVTPFDLVGANRWQVQDNIVSNFVKGDGNQVSYGVFMKGGSKGGKIERNLIVCTPQAISQAGVRVGLSFGGGTTGKAFCRDPGCQTEHALGIAANNIIAHCNDSGIDINRSSDILVAHNTLINTAGIDVRGDTSTARVYGNMQDGTLRQRNGGHLKLEMHEAAPPAHFFENADSLNLAWKKVPESVPSLPLIMQDFYAQPRAEGTLPGAIELDRSKR